MAKPRTRKDWTGKAARCPVCRKVVEFGSYPAALHDASFEDIRDGRIPPEPRVHWVGCPDHHRVKGASLVKAARAWDGFALGFMTRELQCDKCGSALPDKDGGLCIQPRTNLRLGTGLISYFCSGCAPERVRRPRKTKTQKQTTP
jgi:hypothetical protein